MISAFANRPLLNGKYLIQYRSPFPACNPIYDLYSRDTGRNDAESFPAFAEEETLISSILS